MPQVVRWFVGMHHRRINCKLNWAAIDRQSVVLISASQGPNEECIIGVSIASLIGLP